jgi:hypothetical protein
VFKIEDAIAHCCITFLNELALYVNKEDSESYFFVADATGKK